jgi:TonB-linked SusC/RagA family outer membrane protein
LASTSVFAQRIAITGTVTDESGNPLPGSTVQVKGTNVGVSADIDGTYSLDVSSRNVTLVFSFVGYATQEIPAQNQAVINATLKPDVLGLDEVIVVGYGTQKKSDITGTVASLPRERLEMAPNINIAQAIQGAIPGVMIQTSSSGASPEEAILIRGRNSITASNNPLIVVDGIPYSGQISDLNPNDVKSIEILKDASSAAIYGSRGSNGVILISTREGATGKPVINYDGKYSIQTVANIPKVMDGGEFYDFKMLRRPQHMTAYEIENYESGDWINWYDLALRNGSSQQHNLSISGGTNNIKYYVSGGLTDVKGLAIKDDYVRAVNRINLDIKFTDWLSIGTRTQLSYSDQSGIPADFSEVLYANPLTTPYTEDGDLTIFPWPGNEDHVNALEQTIWNNMSKSYQVVTNNFAIIDFPFLPGLSYRFNSGIKMTYNDEATYLDRNSTTGFLRNGSSETSQSSYNNVIVENIFSYTRKFGMHNIFATALMGFEKNKNRATDITARGFPHDFLTYYSIAQAELVEPAYTFESNHLISQMLRLNYSYGDRYLATLTVRRDGFSGFGSKTKFGNFPSIALGWNINKEKFFPWNDLINVLKVRASVGLNGNQAVGPYQSISRLTEINMVDGSATLAGYEPSVLGSDNLGWESSLTTNLGLDFGILENRISGDVNIYKTHTTDLLLERTISMVHGITSIIQNIGETENKGFEISVNSRNIVKGDFKWFTSGNFSFVKNKILSLYGEVDEEGNEIDDINNAWFIGQPIRVNYGFEWLGTWQLDEADTAALYKSKPGYVKLRDVNNDHVIDAADRVIIGQLDPKVLWGLTNTFSYKNFSLSIFMHGVHGITKQSRLMTDRNTQNEIRRNTIVKDWWTVDNPTNDWVMNHTDAEYMSGQLGLYYQDASFVRVKDISLSYDLPKNVIGKIGLNRIRLYVTGRNLHTFTKWKNDLDPELDDQYDIPLQKEYVLGLTIDL